MVEGTMDTNHPLPANPCESHGIIIPQMPRGPQYLVACTEPPLALRVPPVPHTGSAVAYNTYTLTWRSSTARFEAGQGQRTRPLWPRRRMAHIYCFTRFITIIALGPIPGTAGFDVGTCQCCQLAITRGPARGGRGNQLERRKTERHYRSAVTLPQQQQHIF